MTTKHQQSKKIMNDIRQILNDEWDPIGIKGFGPDDEYDSYIGTLYHLLTNRPSEDKIINLLYSFETTQMGSTIEDKESLRVVAKKLLEVNVFLNE